MKPIVPALVIIVVLPLFSQAQSTLNFPHVISAADFSTTGFAVVNPGATDASAAFTLFGADGSTLNSSLQTIKAGAQVAKLANQLFPGAGTGWVQVTSTTTGLTGFWFGGDLVTFADGTEPAPSGSELVLPMAAPVSEIHVVNTGAADATLVMNLLSANGLDLDLPFVQRIPARGFFKANASVIFPKADLTQATHMRLKCGCTSNSFAALLLARDFIAAPSWSIVNAIPASTSTLTLAFPHMVDGAQGSANWESVLSVTNLSTTSANSVTIVFTAENGTAQSVQRSIQPNGTVRETARDMFGFTTGFQNGWVSVSAALPVAGALVFAETVGDGVSAVSAQSDAQTNLLFAHIADLPPWWTGLALLNANPRPANVEIFAMNPDGSLIGGAANVPTARFSLAAGSKVAKLLSEWIPGTQTRTSDGGFIFIRSDLPLFGIELFFSRNTQILANVPAARIPAGSYAPPSPH